MDKRYALFGFLALAALIYLGRNRVLDIITRAGGFDLIPGGATVEELPQVKVPALPGFKPGPSSWTQSTGFMCDCSSGQYVGPVLVNTITVPANKYPRYVHTPKSIAAAALEAPRTYNAFGMNDSFTIWGGRPYEQVWLGSDGRVFLRSGPSDNPLFIGTDEYTMTDGVIHYGPYTYTADAFAGVSGMARSA